MKPLRPEQLDRFLNTPISQLELYGLELGTLNRLEPLIYVGDLQHMTPEILLKKVNIGTIQLKKIQAALSALYQDISGE